MTKCLPKSSSQFWMVKQHQRSMWNWAFLRQASVSLDPCLCRYDIRYKMIMRNVSVPEVIKVTQQSADAFRNVCLIKDVRSSCVSQSIWQIWFIYLCPSGSLWLCHLNFLFRCLTFMLPLHQGPDVELYSNRWHEDANATPEDRNINKKTKLILKITFKVCIAII